MSCGCDEATVWPFGRDSDKSILHQTDMVLTPVTYTKPGPPYTENLSIFASPRLFVG